MSKAILICGKICSGKTFYTKKLCKENNIVTLSSDELICTLFHPDENVFHDKIIKNVHKYLMNKSLEILKAGTDVLLDWGFWAKADRDSVSQFYRENGFETQWHYLNVSDENWKRNIKTRNDDVLNKNTTDFYIDEGLLNKLLTLFEAPSRGEIDVWVES